MLLPSFFPSERFICGSFPFFLCRVPERFESTPFQSFSPFELSKWPPLNPHSIWLPPQQKTPKSTNFIDSPSLTDHPVAPDQFDPKWETDKFEIWSYYAYYIGNNGLTLFNFAPTAFQNLLYQAAGDGTSLFFAGRERTNNSIVLLSNGISFAIQIVVFLFLGSFADFGTWRPNILIALSLVAWGIGFGWLDVHDPSKWEIATGLYIVGLIAYQTTLTF